MLLKLLKTLKKLFNHNLFDLKNELICFVCGNESLPEPLNDEDENYWLNELKNGNEIGGLFLHLFERRVCVIGL